MYGIGWIWVEEGGCLGGWYVVEEDFYEVGMVMWGVEFFVLVE